MNTRFNAVAKFTAALTLSLAPYCVAAADEQPTYLCIVDLATGFNFVSGNWKSVNFPPGAKYIVRPARGDELKLSRWVVVAFGEERSMARCEEFNQYGWLVGCNGIQEFKFNKETLKFLTAYLIGYVRTEPGKENDNTPSIEMGKCSRI
jgi:hypothetical protein